MRLRLGEAALALMGVQLGSIEAARCKWSRNETQPSVLVLTGEPGRTYMCASNGAEYNVRAMMRVDVS